MKKQEGLVNKRKININKKVSLGIFLILLLLSLSGFIVSIQKTNNNAEVDKVVEQYREKLNTIKIDKYLEVDHKDINEELIGELEREIEVLKVLNKNIKSDKLLTSSEYAKEQKQKLLVDLEKTSIKMFKQEKTIKVSQEEIKIKEEKAKIEKEKVEKEEKEKEEHNKSEKPVRDQDKANITPNSKPQTKPQPKPDLKPETVPEDSETVQSPCSNGAQKRPARYVEYFSPSGELVSKDRIDECGLAWDFYTGEFLYDTNEWQ
ncbi:MAG: hypothetical protein GX752_08865 [Clostridium sp.]|nr:hypothetical protein [Clostridium sp.]